MTLSESDSAAIRRLRDFGSGLVSDTLLDLGVHDHIADPGIRPVNPEHVCAGPIRTAQFERIGPDVERDFTPLARFIDAAAPGEVLVLAGAADAESGALWGDLCALAAERHETAGVVIDGLMRDEQALGEGALPVFSRGAFSRDGLAVSNITGVDVPVTLGAVVANSGDIAVADIDGVVFFSPSLMHRVVELCEGKLESEEQLRKLLEEPGSSLLVAVNRTGVM